MPMALLLAVSFVCLVGVCITVSRRRWGRAAAFGIVGVLPVALVWCVGPEVMRYDRGRPACVGHQHMILLTLKMYAMDHQEAYPPDFRSIANTNYLEASLFICPSSGHRAGSLSNVNEWTDYAYVSGLTEVDPSGCVHLFCPPENHRGEGGMATFIDGHVEWLPAADFVRLTSTPSLFFGTTNEEVLADLQRRTKILYPTKQLPDKGRR